MPTDTEMSAYAANLPLVYREILAAFPTIDPRRRAGDSIAFQTLAIHFVNTKKEFNLGDVREACMRLAEDGFFEIKNGIFAHPTDLGEQLISAVTGRAPVPRSGVPQLPARNW